MANLLSSITAHTKVAKDDKASEEGEMVPGSSMAPAPQFWTQVQHHGLTAGVCRSASRA